MGIGVGLFLVAVGAVLAFAVHSTVSGVDITTIGWIVLAVGVAGILLDLILFMPRRRRYSSQAVVYDDAETEIPVTGRRRVVRRDIDTSV